MYALSKRFDRDFAKLSEFRPMFGELDRWFSDMDRFFTEGMAANSAPHLTSVKTDGGYEVRADLPGFEEDQVKLDVHNGVLTLSGERQTGNWDDHKATRRERGSLKFSTSLRLPEDVDTEKVSATLKDGVLTVALAQREEVKPRQIKVNGG